MNPNMFRADKKDRGEVDVGWLELIILLKDMCRAGMISPRDVLIYLSAYFQKVRYVQA